MRVLGMDVVTTFYGDKQLEIKSGLGGQIGSAALPVLFCFHGLRQTVLSSMANGVTVAHRSAIKSFSKRHITKP